MKVILGLLMILGGIVLGLYVGLWWAFIGGIIQLIQAIRAPELIISKLAWGITKIIFAQFFGYISAYVLVIPGIILINKSKKSVNSD